MSDIYGNQTGILVEMGLADASDPDDFKVKLESLQTIWDSLVPGFFKWFKSNRSEVFQSNLVLSSREQLNISGRYFSNNVESAHRLQKKFLKEEGVLKSDLSAVSLNLEKWASEFYCELTRSLRGLGRYRLAVGYEHFLVSERKWNSWSQDRRQQHLQKFFDFRPSVSNLYKKPASAGLKKAPRQPRRGEKKEAELFQERCPDPDVQSHNPILLKLTKSPSAS